MSQQSLEAVFLERLASGGLVSQDEYDQTAEYLDPAALAEALARRFNCTKDARFLLEAARLYLQNDMPYHALEACSRSPRARGLAAIASKAIDAARREYPGTRQIGKLLDEAFLIIDLETGHIVRFPPVFPARN